MGLTRGHDLIRLLVLIKTSRDAVCETYVGSMAGGHCQVISGGRYLLVFRVLGFLITCCPVLTVCDSTTKRYTYGSQQIPAFGNGTEICCGECRFTADCFRGSSNEPWVTAVCVLGGFWIGCMVAFVVDRVIGSPLPVGFGERARQFLAVRIAWLRDVWFSREVEGDTIGPRSESRRAVDAEVYLGPDAGDDFYVFDEQYSTFGSSTFDGIDEDYHSNVTVHTF